MGCIFCRHKITHFHLSKFHIFRQKKKRQKKWLLPGKKWWTYPSGNFSELGSLAVYSISYSLHIHITKKWQKLPASMRSIYFILSRVMKKIQKKNFFLPISKYYFDYWYECYSKMGKDPIMWFHFQKCTFSSLFAYILTFNIKH